MTIQKLWFGLIFSIIWTGLKTPRGWAQQFSVYISRFTQCPYYFWSWDCSNSLLCLHIVSCCRHSVLMIKCDTCCDYRPSGGTCWKPTDRKTTSRGITAATSVSSSSHQTAVCERKRWRKAPVKVVWNQLWTESDLFYSDSLGIRGDKASIPFGRSRDIMTYLRGHACNFFFSLLLWDGKCQGHSAPDGTFAIFKVLFVALLIFSLCSPWRGSKAARHGVGDDKSAVVPGEPREWQRRGRSLLLTK